MHFLISAAACANRTADEPLGLSSKGKHEANARVLNVCSCEFGPFCTVVFIRFVLLPAPHHVEIINFHFWTATTPNAAWAAAAPTTNLK